jgi:hypothetical protein
MEDDKCGAASDGPSMLHYVEQRFRGIDTTTEATAKAVDDRFKHLEQLLTLGQSNAQRAVDKAEATQTAHNVATNEWRATLNDFKATLVSRSEFERFYTEFSAYRLEQSRQASNLAGAKEGAKEVQQVSREGREDWKSNVALIVAIAAVIVAYLVRHT